MRCDFCKENIDEAFEGYLNRLVVNGYNKKLCNVCYKEYINREDEKVNEVFNKVISKQIK